MCLTHYKTAYHRSNDLIIFIGTMLALFGASMFATWPMKSTSC